MQIKTQLKELENQGFTVFTAHNRRFKSKTGKEFLDSYSRRHKHNDSQNELLNHGGETIVELRHEDIDVPPVVAVSKCSKDDMFSYRRGRMIAIGRAIKKAENMGLFKKN